MKKDYNLLCLGSLKIGGNALVGLAHWMECRPTD